MKLKVYGYRGIRKAEILPYSVQGSARTGGVSGGMAA